jgi:hypothetical protein
MPETLGPANSPLPPLSTSPRSSDRPRSFTATSWFFPDKQRKPASPQSRESGPRSRLRQPPLAADSELLRPRRQASRAHGEQAVLPVPSPCSPSPSSAAAPWHLPRPPRSIAAGHAPATQMERRRHQMVRLVELRRFPPSARSITASIGRLPRHLRAQGRADVSMTSA